MKSRIFHTRSEEETIALGETLAAEFPAKAVVLLIGNLGAGKTTLAKGIVKGLGAAQAEAGPTHPQPLRDHREVDHQRRVREAQLG